MHQDNYSKAPGLRRSDLWEIHKSPQHFHAKMQEPKEPSPAMLFGIAAHKYILEPDTFFDEYAVAPKVDKRTKAGKETWAAFVEDCTTNDKEAIDETTFQQIKDMTEALYANPLAKQVLEGQHETEWYWTDPDTQEPLKAKCDNITTFVCSKASNWRIKVRDVAELSISTTATGRLVGRPSRIRERKKTRQINGATIIPNR